MTNRTSDLIALVKSLFIQEEKSHPSRGDAVALCAHGTLDEKKHIFRLASRGAPGVSRPFSFLFLCDECLPRTPFDENFHRWVAEALPKMTRVAVLLDDVVLEAKS